MRRVFWVVTLILSTCGAALGEAPPIPHAAITAPVVHSNGYHVLTSGSTAVVLDGTRGLMIDMLCYDDVPDTRLDSRRSVLQDVALRLLLQADGREVVCSQAYDPSPRLLIIDQGPDRVAARAFFTVAEEDGTVWGSGTMDFYVYNGKLFLTPSLHLEYNNGGVSIIEAALDADAPGTGAELIVNGSKLIPADETRFVPFGGPDDGFNMTVSNPGYDACKIGWIRNTVPSWLYLREVDENPETDELYEKWPLWITQRGQPLSWLASDNAGLVARYSPDGLDDLSFRWVHDDTVAIAEGGFKALNGTMALFMGEDIRVTEGLWQKHRSPVKPKVQTGDFRYYNEIEGIYEIDSQGGDVDVVFENLDNRYDNEIFVRLWNLNGSGGYEARALNNTISVALYNDGDIVEDPMVPMRKYASGPARFAGIALHIGRGSRQRLTFKKSPGIQLTYQMYSPDETYEAWSDVSADIPLFRLHSRLCALYDAAMPGAERTAFVKLPLYWLKNGINRNTFMNQLRGLEIEQNGPDALSFTVGAVNITGQGHSVYTVSVPYDPFRLVLDIDAAFKAYDDGVRWTSLEYCDLYPFDSVYRREFHYDNVVYLTSEGAFDRVGTGAWSGAFKTVEESLRLGYYSEVTKREGPGAKVPDSADGLVWMVGDNPERGNIIYRRGAWESHEGSRSVFALCNAWVDIHNTIVNRPATAAPEHIAYTIEVFGGKIPSVERLTELFREAAGDDVKPVTGISYGTDGSIDGFTVE